MNSINGVNRIILITFVVLYTIQISNGWHITKNNVILRAKRQSDCDFRFRCNSGDCLELEFQCDGKADCPDGSDETKASCGNVRCPPYLFQCKYGACVPKDKVCNGEKDCADNSDEETPNCQTLSTGGKCKNFEFRCRNGDCIDNLLTCDGNPDCADGSDETEEACKGLVCQDYLYRCAYGACVQKSARCNGINECADGSDETEQAGCSPVTSKPTSTSTTLKPTTPPTVPSGSGCLLPTHIPNGRYIYYNQGVYIENTYTSSSTAINLTCNDGFLVSKLQTFVCLGTRWLPSLSDGTCTRTCRPLPSTDTYNTRCFYNNQAVSCENPVVNTWAKTDCKPLFVYKGNRANPLCKENGVWDPYPSPCEPECGQKIVGAQELVIGGKNALKGEYPWMVAVYNVSKPVPEHICGGTIISRFYIVSAGHCFANNNGVAYPENYFSIAAGKYYRDLTINEDDIQIKQIKRIFVHDDYRGLVTKYRDDIALVQVDSFELTPQVQPVCVDWSSLYEDLDFTENKTAVVAGWGFTTEGSTPSEVLKKLIVPYRSKDICKEYMKPEFFQQFYSSDKICAGFKDEGSSVCNGDSGGGLYFKSLPTTFYIRGVVSLSPRSTVGCDSNHYALYTKVSKYLPWIEQITRKIV